MSDSYDAIAATFDATSKAWADGDAAAFADWYAEDASVILPGFHLRGKAEISDSMAGAFAGALKGSRRIHSVGNVRFLSPDAAVVVTSSSTVFPGEAEAPADRLEAATWVLVRRDFRWLVKAYHSCLAN